MCKKKKEAKIGNTSVAAVRADFVETVDGQEVRVRGCVEQHSCSECGESQLISLRFVLPEHEGNVPKRTELEERLRTMLSETGLLMNKGPLPFRFFFHPPKSL